MFHCIIMILVNNRNGQPKVTKELQTELYNLERKKNIYKCENTLDSK